MSTNPKVKRFRIRRGDDAAPQADTPAPDTNAAPDEIDAQINAISNEGLSARQLRMARRVAQKHGLTFTSEFDAIRQLRAAGIDPFQQKSVLELVMPDGHKNAGQEGQIQLPQKVSGRNTQVDAQSGLKMNPTHAAEIRQIQLDIARRRRRKIVLLFTRLAFFVFLPTFMMGWYFYTLATPMYATKSEIVIQQAQSASAAPGGLSTLFQGTSMATQQDSIAVQSYLASREAMLRLDADHGFKAHYTDSRIDSIQRLAADATNEETFKLYSDHVRISYDPTEGIIKMEVIAADPETSFIFSTALIAYAEEQVDQLTGRLRTDQMKGALQSYEDAEIRRAEALATWLNLQETMQQIDAGSESGARMGQINALESERQQLSLVLQSRLNVERPSQIQVQALRDQIANIDALIAELRQELTGSDGDGASLAARNTELRVAEENYNFQTAMVQQALTQMETARIEANRQVRYLSQSVNPVIPDQAAYPRAFENTLLSLLIFSGIYLLISITVSILREQVSS
ncbi:capsular polysaccharide transport system permease protein [Yoonia tamlensis]|uniref:Capsular polysaccharide transport system permease protein n=1 Tax=Yoonia tamlensis TaxID=390270 RepID=A0A1I6GYG2_9RHOB|nr:capsule biosynthesis protein [Yoonia tamlensis]SFR47262.1 capsular polysaccharide transport system permease protein [Yoonia tamlensis]